MFPNKRETEDPFLTSSAHRHTACVLSFRLHCLKDFLFLTEGFFFHLFFSSGPFIERAIIASHTSEALWFNSEDVLPKPAEEEEEE